NIYYISILILPRQLISILFPYTTLFRSLLCTCVNCLKENPNGIQLNLNTYNRHRKRQQELSKKDEILEVIEQKKNVKVFESQVEDRKSTRLNSSHRTISYAVFCLKKKKK